MDSGFAGHSFGELIVTLPSSMNRLSSAWNVSIVHVARSGRRRRRLFLIGSLPQVLKVSFQRIQGFLTVSNIQGKTCITVRPRRVWMNDVIDIGTRMEFISNVGNDSNHSMRETHSISIVFRTATLSRLAVLRIASACLHSSQPAINSSTTCTSDAGTARSGCGDCHDDTRQCVWNDGKGTPHRCYSKCHLPR